MSVWHKMHNWAYICAYSTCLRTGNQTFTKSHFNLDGRKETGYQFYNWLCADFWSDYVDAVSKSAYPGGVGS